MLPIKKIIPELKQQLTLHNQVILQAPPGAGKSTYLPLFLLKEGGFSGKIILLEPRRLAARNIAYYLADQLNQSVGQQVGYRLRGETKVSSETQLEVVTEGILIRLLQNDPELNDVDLIIFDEFHERNMQADLGLALSLDAQSSLRDDLRLLIMSATLDNAALQKHLPQAAYIGCEGRSYPIEYIYQPVLKLASNGRSHHASMLHQTLISVIKQAFTEQSGHILVFVAGVKEIQACCRDLQHWLKTVNQAVLLAPLYGQLSLDEQQTAIQSPAGGLRKIVVATNIAETSLTIEGITVVVDSGMERTVKFQGHTGIGKRQTQKISDASATQRAGRAGRLSAGVCYRLWAKESPLQPQNEAPILQTELTSLVLETSAWGVTHPNELPFLTLPPTKHVELAQQLLQSLNAIDDSGRCTKHGEQIVELGLSPRLGHMLLSAIKLQANRHLSGLSALACLMAAFLESNEKCDDDIVNALAHVSYSVNVQYKKLLKKCTIKAPKQLPFDHCGLLLAMAYPDRIAMRRDPKQPVYLLTNGAGARLNEQSHLLNETWLVIADLALSQQQSNSLIYKACPISLDTIKAELPDYLTSVDYLFWSVKANKLIAEKRLMLGKISLTRTALSHITQAQKQEALLNGIRQGGLTLLFWSDANQALLTRLRYAQLQYQLFTQQDFADFSEAALSTELATWLAPFCLQVTQPEQLKKIDLKAALLSRLNWAQQQAFDQDFPLTVTVPTGSKIRLQYRQDQAPLLSVKMQELYGQAQTPCIFNGRIAIQLALLSPAMKPLQLTQNLSSFWSGAYKEVQKEMKGRYPKHFWPDDPAVAMATRKTKKYLS